MGIREFPVNFLRVTICTLFILISLSSAEPESNPSTTVTKGNGFGEHYDWAEFEEGFKIAAETKRPLMLIIFQPWCGACKALKPLFAQSSAIEALSEKFVLVNTIDDDDIMGESYKPDGGYIPRILFFDSNGTLLKDVINEGGSPQYKYFYPNDQGIVKSMEAVLKRLEVQDQADTENVKAEL